MTDTATKHCTKCGKTKPLSEFHRHRKSRDGINHYCKACAIEKAREWYAANRSAGIAQRREYRHAHLDAVREYDRQRSVSRREWKQEYDQQYNSAIKAAVLAYYSPDDPPSCTCCGVTGNLAIDHIEGNGGNHRQEIFGRRQGGGKQFWRWLINEGFPPGYQVLCVSCNQSKQTGPACRLDHAKDG